MSIEAMKRVKSWLQDTKMIDSHTISAVVAECDAVILSQQPTTPEPVYWEWRHLSTHPDTVDFGKWSEWKRVEARSAIHTIDDALVEFRAYIAQGYKYELRALYDHPAPSAAVTPEPVKSFAELREKHWAGIDAECAKLDATGEPVHQIRKAFTQDAEWAWRDATEALFHMHPKEHRRILYTHLAPSAAVTPEPVQADSSEHLRVIASLGAALRRLSFAAQTTGGTDGPDAELQSAIGQAEQALSLGGIWQAMSATPEPVVDVRCGGCGYMTHHREHMGCVRAAKQHTHPAPSVPDVDFELQELREIERAMDDFADCGETDVVDTLLLRAVQAGFLECTHFHVANRGALQEAIDAAMLAAKKASA